MAPRFWMAIAAGGAMAVAAPATAQAIPHAPILTPAELEQLRGGFEAPNGQLITLGVTTDTAVNGQEILRSTFQIVNGMREVSVAANQSGTFAPVAAAINGAGVDTADGVVRMTADASGTRIELSGNGIDVTHLVGQSLGSIIANTGNDRSIDTTTTINIGLSGVAPDTLGSAMARVANLALASTALLSH